MNKPIDDPKKRTDVVPVEPPKVPATKKPPDKWKLHGILTGCADAMVARRDEIWELQEQLYKRQRGEALPDVEQAELDKYDHRALARCRELLKLLDPEDAYEDDADFDPDDPYDKRLKRDYIGKRLGLLLAAMPVGKASTPDGFVKMLLEHVADTDVCVLSLEDACRELERTAKFLPTISEVVTAIEKHRALWGTRRSAIQSIEYNSKQLRDAIRNKQPQFELEQAEANVDRLRQAYSERLHSLNWARNNAIVKQNAAREAHLQVEEAMTKMAPFEQRFEEANAALSEAHEALWRIKDLINDKPKPNGGKS
jgi:hypothetical protein